MRYTLALGTLIAAAAFGPPAAAEDSPAPATRLDERVARLHARAEEACTKAHAKADEAAAAHPERAAAAQAKAQRFCAKATASRRPRRDEASRQGRAPPEAAPEPPVAPESDGCPCCEAGASSARLARFVDNSRAVR